jgi:hypothetical protein
MLDRDPRVEQLLGSPLGRAVIAELAGVDVSTLTREADSDPSGSAYGANAVRSSAQAPKPNGTIPLTAKQLDRAVSVIKTMASPQPILEQEEDKTSSILARVGSIVENYAFGPSSRWRPFQPALAECTDALRAVADAVVDCSSLSWWWTGVAADEQRWFPEQGEPSQTEDDDDFSLPELSHPPADWWWVSEVDSRFPRTTRGPVEGYLSVGAVCRDGHQTPPLYPANVWSMDVNPKARICEIQSAGDWVNLVELFPRSHPGNSEWDHFTGCAGPWYVPEWAAVRQYYDAVHVTFGAFLTAAYRALPLSGIEGKTILVGWNPDETLWLSRKPRATRIVGVLDEAN